MAPAAQPSHAASTTADEKSADSSSSAVDSGLVTKEGMTIVTNSPVPSEIEETVTDCPRRSSGLVCVCTQCEAARMRLLDSQQPSTIKAAATQKRKGSTQNDDNDDNLSNTKRRATTKAVSSSSPAVAPNEISTSIVPAVAASSATDTSAAAENTMTQEERISKMSTACRTILECVGEDPTREGLVKTPQRWAKALLFFCHGYSLTASKVTNDAVFSENHNEMVVVKNIDIHSLCEHHMVPFSGRVHIGYIPNGKIVGLSKLARLAEMYARRLQVQERLTRQIADAVVETVQPLGVAVVVECTHFCMVMRGVQKTSAVTTTSSVRGCFETNSKTRAEFFSILHGNPKMC